MSSEWKFSELGKISQNASRPFDFKKHKNVCFVNTGDVLEGFFLHSNITSAIGLPGQAKKAIKKGDILLTEIRPGNGRYAYVDFDAENYVVSTKFMVIQCGDLVDSRFLYHVIKNKAALYEFQRIAESRSGTFPQITFDSIAHFPVPIPPQSEQKNLVNFLDAIDDRITLLRETNTTLEAIAQALFKSWFVDFDPVHAKQQGRAPEGMDAQTAALFPDSFEESELGMVPKGWKATQVYETAEIVKGKSYSSKDLAVTHDTALVTLKSFERGGGFRMDGFKPYTGTYKQSQVVVPGDLIIAYTDVTQAAELIGKPAIVVGVKEYSTLVASLDVGIVRPDEKNCGKQFLYGLFRTEKFQSHTLAHTSGTTVLHLAKDGVGSFNFVLPSSAVVKEFEKIADAIS